MYTYTRKTFCYYKNILISTLTLIKKKDKERTPIFSPINDFIKKGVQIPLHLFEFSNPVVESKTSPDFEKCNRGFPTTLRDLKS